MDPIEALLREAEQNIHSQGWDQAPQLALLERLPGDELQIPAIFRGIDGHPPEFLKQLGLVLAADVEQARHILGEAPQLWAVAIAIEGWMAPPDITDEQREQAAAQRRGYAHLPAARDCRTVTALAPDGGTYMVYRIRGGEPEFERATEETVVGGALYVGLRGVLVALALHLPRGSSRIVEDLMATDSFPALVQQLRASNPG